MSTSSNNRLSGGDEKTYLRHYPSTPHLDTLRANKNNTSTVLLNAASNLNLSPTSYMPKTTLSTFASHGKSKSDVRFRDDPNPYKVSEIEKYRIKVHDPYVPKSHHRSQQGLSFYTDDSSCNDNFNDDYDKMEGRYFSNNIHRSQTMKSTNSHRSALSGSHTTAGRSSRISSSTSSTGDIECEIPEPDYDDHRSTAGSSEDIPIPLPESSCSEEYSSVSAGSDPDHYNLEAPDALNTFPDESRTGEDSGVDTPAKITEKDRMRIEYALKGRKTTVYVSDSLANLYVMKKASGSRSQIGAGGETDKWDLKYTGVPVLLLDSGETKSRDRRRIQIVLAEFGTGLALWKDVIDNLTNYKATEGSLIFHTMHLSSDHTKIIGLSFDDEESAVNFSNRVDKLTSDFANISLSGSKTKGKNKKDKSKGSKPVKYVKPKKSEISQPCCFTHVSSLSSKDRGRLSSLQHFIVPETFSSNRSPSSNIESSSVSNTSLTIPNKSVTSSGSEISF